MERCDKNVFDSLKKLEQLTHLTLEKPYLIVIIIYQNKYEETNKILSVVMSIKVLAKAILFKHAMYLIQPDS